MCEISGESDGVVSAPSGAVGSRGLDLGVTSSQMYQHRNGRDRETAVTHDLREIALMIPLQPSPDLVLTR